MCKYSTIRQSYKTIVYSARNNTDDEDPKTSKTKIRTQAANYVITQCPFFAQTLLDSNSECVNILL